MIIYADEIFLLNFVASVILFLAVCVIFGFRIKPLRLCAVGVISGLYAVAEAAFGLWYGARFAVMAACVAVAFGRHGFLMNLLRLMNVSVCAVIFTAVVNMLLNGDALLSGGNVVLFSDGILMGVVCLLAYPITVAAVKLRRKRNRYRQCVFEIGEIPIYVRLLYDSGNLLTHNGIPVAVVSKSITDSLGIECDGYETVNLTTIEGTGKLPIVKPRKSIIDGIERDIYIAISDYDFKGSAGLIGI